MSPVGRRRPRSRSRCLRGGQRERLEGLAANSHNAPRALASHPSSPPPHARPPPRVAPPLTTAWRPPRARRRHSHPAGPRRSGAPEPAPRRPLRLVALRSLPPQRPPPRFPPRQLAAMREPGPVGEKPRPCVGLCLGAAVATAAPGPPLPVTCPAIVCKRVRSSSEEDKAGG